MCASKHLFLIGCVDDWHVLLFECIEMEWCVEVCQLASQWGESPKDGAVLISDVEILVLCILHLEN